MNAKRVMLALVLAVLCLGSGIVTFASAADDPWEGDIVIKSDGSVTPSDAPMKISGNNYKLTSDIEGMITIEKNNVDLNGNGYSIIGDYEDHGIVLDGIDGVTIKGFNIYYAYDGIHLKGSCRNTVKDNSVFDCYNAGIALLDGSDGNTIKMNYVTGNFFAISLGDSGENVIKENTVVSNYLGIDLYYSDDNIVKENTINYQAIWGIAFRYSANDMAKGNDIDGGEYYGIGMWGGDGCHIVWDNTIKNFCSSGVDWGVGIYLSGTSDVTVKENELYDNFIGIGSWYTHDIIIRSNYVTGSIVPAIYIDTSTSNCVDNNEIIGNGFGIFFFNNDEDLQMDNLITYNLIEGNYMGIVTEDEMLFGTTYAQDAGGNTIHHNCIIDNDVQVYEGYENIWDNGKGEGNYWSDYEGEDIDNDGIGDTDLPHNGVDDFPLMDPCN